MNYSTMDEASKEEFSTRDMFNSCDTMNEWVSLIDKPSKSTDIITSANDLLRKQLDHDKNIHDNEKSLLTLPILEPGESLVIETNKLNCSGEGSVDDLALIEPIPIEKIPSLEFPSLERSETKDNFASTSFGESRDDLSHFSQIEPIPFLPRSRSAPCQYSSPLSNDNNDNSAMLPHCSSVPSFSPAMMQYHSRYVNQVGPTRNLPMEEIPSAMPAFFPDPSATGFVQQQKSSKPNIDISKILAAKLTRPEKRKLQQQQQKPLPPSKQKKKHVLPQSFEPSPYTVICGRGKEATESPGNIRFRAIVKQHVKEFMDSPGKLERSYVVSKVINIIRKSTPEGAFVKFENGRWWEMSDRVVREKVGSLFRDCLPSTYKSSSKNKIERRRNRRMSSGNSVNSDSSSSKSD